MPLPRGGMPVLVEQHELIDENCPQRQQLRTVQPFHRQLRRHSKTFLNRPLNGSMSLGTELMKDTPHLHPAIVVRMGPTPGGYQ